jgi:Tol biopolymer transport system component
MIRSHNLLLLAMLASAMLLGVVFDLPLASATKGSFPGKNGKVAFCAFTSYPKTAIFVMNQDGTDKQQLTSGDFFDDYPCWSPGGTKIVFARAEFGFADYAIWVMNADGTGLRQLTSSGYAISPAWSPDGSRIAFVREEEGMIYMRSTPMVQQATEQSGLQTARTLVGRLTDTRSRLMMVTTST